MPGRIRAALSGLTSRLRKDRSSFRLFLALRAIIVLVIVRSVMTGRYETTALCALSLVMLLVPAFLEETFRLDIPPLFEKAIYAFIFASEILGEAGRFYVHVPGWDTLLHTINGFLAASVGFSMLYLLNRNRKITLSPEYLALTAFCFSMTIGVLWEFVEFGADHALGFDMQKDSIVRDFQSVALDPENDQNAIPVHGIARTTIETEDGETYVIDGYLDIGLSDTMKDLLVNFVGASVCSTLGYTAVRKENSLIDGDEDTLLKRLIVRPSERGGGSEA